MHYNGRYNRAGIAAGTTSIIMLGGNNKRGGIIMALHREGDGTL